MFREGYYLEVIKAKNSAATAVITIKEKTVDIKNKKITTNKWLTLEDWASLYEILEKALLQNIESSKSTEKRKFTRHLEITYIFEVSENPSDRTSLPTIRVGVSAVKKKSRHKSGAGSNKKVKSNDKDKDKDKDKKTREVLNPELFRSEDYGTKVEEYIPDAPSNTKRIDNKDGQVSKIGYVPSRKSTLEFLQQSANSNEYIPSVLSEDTTGVNGGVSDAFYVPNSIPKTKNFLETYEPSSLTVVGSGEGTGDEYIPNSKGLKKKVDEYQPDFIVRNKSMKFDDSYVPSSSQRIKELKKKDRKYSRSSGRKSKSRETERNVKDFDNSNKKNCPLGQSEIKREM